MISSYSDCCVLCRTCKSVQKNTKAQTFSEACGDESSGPFQQTVPVVVDLNDQTDIHVSWICWSLLVKFMKIKLLVLF